MASTAELQSLVNGLLASSNPDVINLAGDLVNQSQLLDAEARLILNDSAIASSRIALAQQNNALAEERAQIAAQATEASRANAHRQLGLSREDLYLNSGINYRDLANNYATAGIGDSGFAARARGEFNASRDMDARQIQLTFDRIIDGVNQQAANDQNTLAGVQLNSQGIMIDAQANQNALAKQQLAIDAQRLALSGQAVGVAAQRGPISVDPTGVGPQPIPIATVAQTVPNLIKPGGFQ